MDSVPHEQLVMWSVWSALPFPADLALFFHLSPLPLCSILGNGSPLLMPFLEMCLHRAGNLISTFPAGKCLVTSAKHFGQGETLLQNQQALTRFKQSLMGEFVSAGNPGVPELVCYDEVERQFQGYTQSSP